MRARPSHQPPALRPATPAALPIRSLGPMKGSLAREDIYGDTDRATGAEYQGALEVAPAVWLSCRPTRQPSVCEQQCEAMK